MKKIIVNLNELKGTSFYRNYIEKAKKGEMVGGKYMYREEVPEKVKTSKGKTTVIRYKYYYLTDMLKDSAEKLLENIGKFFFKGNEKEVKKIENSYKTQNIEKDYGADKKTWYQHCMEYLSHKAKWDKRFSNKDNAEKFKTPIKQKVAEKVDIPGMETAAEETPEIKTTIETEKKEATWKPNPSLMRKVWSLYNGVESVNNGVSVGDTVNFNGRKGTVTSKVNDNMVMVDFEDGGLGRFFTKDLNKVDISNESVTNEADVNGKIQEVVTGLNTSNDTVEETNAKKRLDDIANVIKNGGRVEYQNPVLGKIVFDSGILGDLSEKNKGGYGIKHLIASRYLKDKMSVDEISALLLKIGEIAETVIPNDPTKTRINLIKDGIWVGISKQWNGTEETWIITGFPEEESKGIFTKEATDTIKTVIANNSYALENSSIRNQVGAVIASINNNTTNIENINSEHGNKIAMLGNQNAKKQFSDLTQEEKQQKKEQIQNNIVSSIQKDSVPYNNDGAFDKAAKTWLEKNNVGNAETVIGEVIINKRSVERDMHHGDLADKYLKLQTLPAVKDVLEKGTYLGYERDFEGKNISNHYFAAKINYGNEEKIVFCRVRETDGSEERFYVHEVFTEDEIKKGTNLVPTVGRLPQLTGKLLYNFILQEVLNVNSEHGNSTAMLGNDNAKKDFVDVKQGFSEMDKKLLALALYKEKEFNPTMNDYYYYEKLRYKYPNLASKGSIYSIMDELKGIDVKNINLDEVKEYVEKIKGGDGGDEPPKVIMKEKGNTEWGTSYEMENGTPLDAALFLKEKQDGYIENAFSGITKDKRNYKIALCWGHDGLGLKKIIEKHIINFDDFDSIHEAINVITKVLENGRWINVKNDKIRIENGKYVVILQKSSDGVFVVSDYDNSRSPSEKARSESEKNKKRQEVFGMSRTSSLDSEGHLSLNNASNNNYTTSLENVNTKNDNVRNDGLTQDEADSLEYYVQDAGYTYINAKLRGVDNTPMENHHKEAIKNIDSAISRNTIKDKTLYRGIGGNVLFPTMNPYENRLMNLYFSNKSAYDSLPNDEWYDGVLYKGAKDNVERYIKEIEGRTFNDKGYVSTSKTIDGTKVFTDSYQNPIVIEFQNIPENTHGIDLSNFAEGREFKAENEVLLHRDLNYKITGIKSHGQNVVFTAEIIPESELEKHQNRSNAMLGNQNAKKNFVDFIDKFIKNGYKSDKVVNLLDTTPSILQEHGIPNNPISITPSVLKKILENDLNVYHGHNISVDILKDLPNQLENPVYILKGKDGKKIIVTEYYVENRPIITILEVDRKEGRTNVNSVRSLYDKQNDVFMEWIKDDSIVEYENKEKSKVLLQSIGNQYTKEVTTPYINNNTTNIENVNSEHGNKIAMLGNDNAHKDFADIEEDKQEFNYLISRYNELTKEFSSNGGYSNRRTTKEQDEKRRAAQMGLREIEKDLNDFRAKVKEKNKGSFKIPEVYKDSLNEWIKRKVKGQTVSDEWLRKKFGGYYSDALSFGDDYLLSLGDTENINNPSVRINYKDNFGYTRYVSVDIADIDKDQYRPRFMPNDDTNFTEVWKKVQTLKEQLDNTTGSTMAEKFFNLSMGISNAYNENSKTPNIPRYRFTKDGIKDKNGKLEKINASVRDVGTETEHIQLYADNYGTSIPSIFYPENNTDIQTDYFEKDSCAVFPDHPYYNHLKIMALKNALYRGRATKWDAMTKEEQSKVEDKIKNLEKQLVEPTEEDLKAYREKRDKQEENKAIWTENQRKVYEKEIKEKAKKKEEEELDKLKDLLTKFAEALKKEPPVNLNGLSKKEKINTLEDRISKLTIELANLDDEKTIERKRNYREKLSQVLEEVKNEPETEQKESDIEEYNNRSQAMMGNDNAAGFHIVQPREVVEKETVEVNDVEHTNDTNQNDNELVVPMKTQNLIESRLFMMENLKEMLLIN